MPNRYVLVAAALAVVGCATSPASTPTPPVPTPVPAVSPAPHDTTAALKEAPRNWQLLDPATDHVPGISAERAVRELLAGKQPRRTVIVAVIDGGVDTAHADLRANLWVNSKETPANARDDDGNGYPDDMH